MRLELVFEACPATVAFSDIPVSRVAFEETWPDWALVARIALKVDDETSAVAELVELSVSGTDLDNESCWQNACKATRNGIATLSSVKLLISHYETHNKM